MESFRAPGGPREHTLTTYKYRNGRTCSKHVVERDLRSLL